MTARRHTWFPHVVRDPRIAGGEPIIRGTRVPVRSIVLLCRHEGIDGVCRAFPGVKREAVEEALAFYEQNRAEIDHAIAANEREAYRTDPMRAEELRGVMVRHEAGPDGR
jgi:uncharacterized protein (DUF433 family)